MINKKEIIKKINKKKIIKEKYNHIRVRANL